LNSKEGTNKITIIKRVWPSLVSIYKPGKGSLIEIENLGKIGLDSISHHLDSFPNTKIGINEISL
jgi:hypothetical protein